MSWNYMQPNAGLLNHVGAGYNALGKGLLNMGQFVNDIPMNQKKLGLLDAQTWETNNRAGLLGAQTQAQNIENQHLPNSIMAKNNHLNAQTAHLGAQTQGKQIENQYLPKSIMANINHTNSQTNLNNTRAQGQNIENQYAPYLNNQRLVSGELANQAADFAYSQAVYDYNKNQLMNLIGHNPSQALQKEIADNPERGVEFLDREATKALGYNFVGNAVENAISGLLGEENRRRYLQNGLLKYGGNQ